MNWKPVDDTRKHHLKQCRTVRVMLFGAVFFAGLTVQAASTKPNILVAVIDDSGTGEFAPVAKQLQLSEVGPGCKACTGGLDESSGPMLDVGGWCASGIIRSTMVSTMPFP